MVYLIGETYDVNCAQLCWREDGRIYFIPVLGHQHSDPQFGFPQPHYHVDGRFEIHPRMLHRLNIKQGLTNTVITDDPDTGYEFLRIVSVKLKCERESTGLLPPAVITENYQKYLDWYQTFIGQRCKGKRCPHLGTEMLEANGLLVCPMHQLTADAGNFKIVSCHN